MLETKKSLLQEWIFFKTGYSSALTFDCVFNLYIANNIKSGFGTISLILMESFHFMEIHGGKYSLLA